MPKAFADDAASAYDNFDFICFKVGRFGGEHDVHEFLRDISNRATAGANKVVVITDVRVEANNSRFIDFL